MPDDSVIRIRQTLDLTDFKAKTAESRAIVAAQVAELKGQYAQAAVEARATLTDLAHAEKTFGAEAAAGNQKATETLEQHREMVAEARAEYARLAGEVAKAKAQLAEFDAQARGTGNAVQSMGGGFAAARVEAGALSDSTMGLEMGLARLAYSSKTLGPLMQAALPVAVAVGLTELVVPAIFNVIDALGGWDAATKRIAADIGEENLKIYHGYEALAEGIDRISLIGKTGLDKLGGEAVNIARGQARLNAEIEVQKRTLTEADAAAEKYSYSLKNIAAVPFRGLPGIDTAAEFDEQRSRALADQEQALKEMMRLQGELNKLNAVAKPTEIAETLAKAREEAIQNQTARLNAQREAAQANYSLQIAQARATATSEEDLARRTVAANRQRLASEIAYWNGVKDIAAQEAARGENAYPKIIEADQHIAAARTQFAREGVDAQIAAQDRAYAEHKKALEDQHRLDVENYNARKAQIAASAEDARAAGVSEVQIAAQTLHDTIANNAAKYKSDEEYWHKRQALLATATPLKAQAEQPEVTTGAAGAQAAQTTANAEAQRAAQKDFVKGYKELADEARATAAVEIAEAGEALQAKLGALNQSGNMTAARAAQEVQIIREGAIEKQVVLQELEDRLRSLGVQNAAQFAAIERQKVEAVRQANREISEIERKRNEDSERILRENAKLQTEQIKADLDERLGAMNEVGRMGIARANQEIAMVQEAASREIGIEQAHLEQLKQLGLATLEDYQHYQERKTEILRQEAKKREQIEKEEFAKEKQIYDQLTADFNTAINQMIQHQKTASQAMAQMWNAMVMDIIKDIEKWIEEMIYETIIMKALKAIFGTPPAANTGQTAQNTAQATSFADLAVAQVVQEAVATVPFPANIPVAIAAGAAIAAAASLGNAAGALSAGSFEHGGIIPGPVGMPTGVTAHGGEMYLGTKLSQTVQNMASSGGSTRAGATNHVRMNINPTFISRTEFSDSDIRNHSKEIARAVKNEWAQFNR